MNDRSVTRRPGFPLPAFALLMAVAGCDGGPTDLASGNVRFVLSAGVDALAATTSETEPASEPSAPALSDDHDDRMWDRDKRFPPFTSANVTFSSILARNLDGILIDVDMELPVTVDIMRMEDGREVTLPDGNLPPGTYDQIVVVMTAFQGTTRDGTRITIEPPGGGWTAIVPVCPFEVEGEGEAAAVVGLRLSVGRSFSWGDGGYRFQPHFECEPVEPEMPTQG